MLLQLQKGAVYGPIQSRRLGSSLGINVLPASVKVCTFNCLYCHYGWTKVCPQRIAEQNLWPAVPDILYEVEHSLRKIYPKPAYITFSGNGEPTLHPCFAELVDGVIALRDRYSPDSKTAILSNSTTISAIARRSDSARARVRKLPECAVGSDLSSLRTALERLDMRIMKLDCGSDSGINRYNRPCGAIRLADIVAGLTMLDGICIQTLLAGGDLGNAGPHEVGAWIEAVAAIRPLHVQLYTLDRGYASPQIAPLPLERLYEVRERLRAEGIDADVYSALHLTADVLS